MFYFNTSLEITNSPAPPGVPACLSTSRFDHDPRWSESGDRYILKLFRDMVFHQVDEHNKPVLDLSHVLTCLNKVCQVSAFFLISQRRLTLLYVQLDAGSDEKVMLMSRDEQSCLVVSYREIKGCVEAAFKWVSLSSLITAFWTDILTENTLVILLEALPRSQAGMSAHVCVEDG